MSGAARKARRIASLGSFPVSCDCLSECDHPLPSFHMKGCLCFVSGLSQAPQFVFCEGV